ncbi:GDSL esterase/lipase At2g31540-like [Camellia sinensis]|uniref:GDSL esterase/lipase At2g31540-like n=1 Tax=Camellia sinensis TaxID=4442 RepID=UPI0010362105|nr:GDSL esterase/lipase At2g31540-like [Camellia sinensis]
MAGLELKRQKGEMRHRPTKSRNRALDLVWLTSCKQQTEEGSTLVGSCNPGHAFADGSKGQLRRRFYELKMGHDVGTNTYIPGSSARADFPFIYFSSKMTLSSIQFHYVKLFNETEEDVLELQALYNFGATKFGIIGIPPVGCCPAWRCYNATRDFKDVETACCGAGRLNAEIPCNATANLCMNRKEYLLWDLYHPTQTTSQLAALTLYDDFKYVESACCGAGRLNAEILCNATANLCMNRKEYLFWDLYHVTRTASQLAAVMLYDGPPRFVTPITFRQLAEDN